MLDFTPVRKKEISFTDLVKELTVDDLRTLTNEMIDYQLSLIATCTDADVVFAPIDPDAHDAYAVNPEEEDLAWNLGHLIVHVTASSEETAFLAAEMARGVEYEQRRSRSEIHWKTMTTIAQCRARLEESRRMRLASLDMWPDQPYLDNTFTSERTGLVINPVARFAFGLSHDDAHLAQIAEVVRQAGAARNK
ncbi:MAG: DinB family protein [Anaerolineales bacterium]|nr:DinB family protein [Anaerolineales bacterium]